jgi:hypothetical protein
MSTPPQSFMRRIVTRPTAMLLALTMTLVAALLIGSQTTSTAAGTGDTAARSAVAKTVNGKMTSKIVGHTSDGRKVVGTFTPLKFVKKNGQSQVKGVVDGAIKNADGTRETFTALRTIDVKKINGQLINGRNGVSAAAACNILHLVLGPLDLNLLGLVVHLNQVVLDITAVPGAGNLLGNLLCAITGLLDPQATAARQLAPALNAILALVPRTG